MTTPTIKFYYKATKRPKLLENNVFVLYSPQKLKFQPGEKKMVDMKIKIEFPPNITGSCRLLFGLSNCGLYLLNSAYLSDETNLHFEILIQISHRHFKLITDTRLGILHQTIREQKLNTNM